MIPRRTGNAISLDATIPVGNGQLPTINETLPSVDNGSFENGTANTILKGLTAFSKASKGNVVNPETLQALVSRKMIVQAGDYYVVSEKGLTYLLDFNILP